MCSSELVLDIPPLRERLSDLSLLVDHFLARGSMRHERQFEGVTAEVMEAFEGHLWPGNVRELENCLERMMVLSETSMLGTDLLPPGLKNPTGAAATVEDTLFPLPHDGLVLEDLEKDLILQALLRSDGKLEPAAKMLGITYKTLQYRIKKYRLRETSEGAGHENE